MELHQKTITKTDKKKIPGNQHVSDLQSGVRSFLPFSPQHQGPHNANFSLEFTYQHSGDWYVLVQYWDICTAQGSCEQYLANKLHFTV